MKVSNERQFMSPDILRVFVGDRIWI
jgi:hypothetical protein